MTKEDLKEALKELIERTRRQAKAKKRNWKFCVFAVISNQHLSEQRAGAWHIHLIIYGSPASRIAKEMKAYWTSHNYGNPPQQNIGVCDDWGKLRYNIHQWLMNEQCEARFYTHGIEIQDLRDSLIKQYARNETLIIIIKIKYCLNIPIVTFFIFIKIPNMIYRRFPEANIFIVFHRDRHNCL